MRTGQLALSGALQSTQSSFTFLGIHKGTISLLRIDTN